MKLVLPYPPSVNHYWRHIYKPAFGIRVLISAEGRAYRSIVGFHVPKPVKTFKDKLKLSITANPPDRRRRDLDNIVKSLLDSLEHARVYEDDSQIDHLEIRRGDIDKQGGKVVVEVETL